MPLPRSFFAAVLAGCLLICGNVGADDFVTIDFPFHGREIASTGLSAPPRQVTKPDGEGYAEILLRPIRKTDRVFVTFVFEEQLGRRGLAVYWSGESSGERVTISDNLADGLVGLNRRTIALPAQAAAEPGRLYVMGQQSQLLRVRIDWIEPALAAVSVDQERPALIAGGSLLLERDVTGAPALTPPDAWFGRVLDAALHSGVVDLGANVEFVVPLTGTVGPARLRGRFLGLPLGRGVRVWVNGRLAGRITPEVPSLTDAGYVRRGKRAVYAGWRTGGLFLDEGMLKAGDNTVLLESPGPGVFLSGGALEIEGPEVVETPSERAPELAPAGTTVGPSAGTLP